MGKMTLQSIFIVTLITNVNYIFLFFHKVENSVIILNIHIDNLREELP